MSLQVHETQSTQHWSTATVLQNALVGPDNLIGSRAGSVVEWHRARGSGHIQLHTKHDLSLVHVA